MAVTAATHSDKPRPTPVILAVAFVCGILAVGLAVRTCIVYARAERDAHGMRPPLAPLFFGFVLTSGLAGELEGIALWIGDGEPWLVIASTVVLAVALPSALKRGVFRGSTT
jgi:hypothetical protein